MTRRNQGNGSITERAPGVYRLRYAGQSVTFRGGRKAAEREMAQLIARTPVQRRQSTRTLGHLLDEWLKRHAGDTLVSYRAALAHLPAKARDRRIGGLELRDFDTWYAEMTAAGVGAATVRKCHAAIGAALTEAVRWRWIGVNPARGARLPPLQRNRVRIPTAEQINTLVDACTSTEMSAWLRLVLATGARRGEILALRWSTLVDDRLTIAGSVLDDGTVKATKTNRPRTVRIDAVTVETLGALQQLQIDRAAECGYELGAKGHYSGSVMSPGDWWMFSNDIDCTRPLKPDSVSQRFERLCKRAGVTGVRLHDLRHWHASQLLAYGQDIEATAARLGHSRTSTTLDVYGHVLDGRDRVQADIIGSLLDG